MCKEINARLTKQELDSYLEQSGCLVNPGVLNALRLSKGTRFVNLIEGHSRKGKYVNIELLTVQSKGHYTLDARLYVSLI